MTIASDWAKGSGHLPPRDRRIADLVEEVLLGTLVIAPFLRERRAVRHLKPSDFRESWRGSVFGVLIDMKIVSAVGLLHELERLNAEPPVTMGWAEAVGQLLGDSCIDDEEIDAFARIVKEAAVMRRKQG